MKPLQRLIVQRRAAGQASTEAAVLILVLGSALLLPWVDGASPAELLLRAFVGASQTFIFWLSLV
jgi:hypothetical protein